MTAGGCRHFAVVGRADAQAHRCMARSPASRSAQLSSTDNTCAGPGAQANGHVHVFTSQQPVQVCVAAVWQKYYSSHSWLTAGCPCLQAPGLRPVTIAMPGQDAHSQPEEPGSQPQAPLTQELPIPKIEAGRVHWGLSPRVTPEQVYEQSNGQQADAAAPQEASRPQDTSQRQQLTRPAAVRPQVRLECIVEQCRQTSTAQRVALAQTSCSAALLLRRQALLQAAVAARMLVNVSVCGRC